MAKYKVTGIPVRHSGKSYEAGDTIEMAAKDAKRLGDLVQSVGSGSGSSGGNDNQNKDKNKTGDET